VASNRKAEEEVSLTQSQQVLALLFKSEVSVSFGTPQEENDADYRWGSSLHLNMEDWEDMGSPEQVTVTIVPGDTLNG
jgi:uncharacterized protein YaeQ